MARLLVVDDDKDILRFAERVLVEGNYEVFVASDALSAMEYLDKYDFDAIITDINMPHYSGLELVKTIRNNKKFNHIAIAMLTGLREKRHIKEAIEIGVDDYIVKPIDPLMFLKKIESLFEKRPPEQRPEICFSSVSTASSAIMKFEIKIESISELGMTLLSKHKFEPGLIFELETNLFQQMGIDEPPHVKIQTVQEAGPGQWLMRTIFVGTKEGIMQKIRAWVYTHPTRGVNVA